MEIKQIESIKIVGIKTNTDGEKAFEEIPLHWQKFFSEGMLETVPNKTAKDIYGIYTSFANEGENNKGIYSFIIGVEVDNFDDVPKDLDSVIIPKSNYQIFSAENKPQQIGEKWKEIWQHDFKEQRTFLLEYEKYQADGNIEICIGVKA